MPARKLEGRLVPLQQAVLMGENHGKKRVKRNVKKKREEQKGREEESNGEEEKEGEKTTKQEKQEGKKR